MHIPLPLLLEELLLPQFELAFDAGAPLGFFYPNPVLALARLALALGALPPLLLLAYAAGLFVASALLRLRPGAPLSLLL